MKPFTPEGLGAATSDLTKQCLDLAARAELPVRDLATLCATAPATLYRWQKEAKEGRLADPQGKMSATAFMNLLIFRVAISKELENESLPSDGKKGARKWIRQLAPGSFNSDAS